MTCLDSVAVRYTDDFDGLEVGDAYMASYLAYQEDSVYESPRPALYAPKSRAKKRAEREANFQMRIAKEKAAERRAAREAKVDPKKLIAFKEAELEAIDDYMVANVSFVRHAKALTVSGSTGKSREVRRLTNELNTLKGLKVAKRGPSSVGPKSISQGEVRNRALCNAQNIAANLIKVLTDQSEYRGTYLRMQTLTFDPAMPLLQRFEALRAIRDMFRRDTEEFVITLGVGGSEDERQVCAVDGAIAKDRLHLHAHCFNHQGSRKTFLKAVTTVMTRDKEFSKYPEWHLHNERVAKKVVKAKGYHWAVYGAKNIGEFKPRHLDAIVSNGLYSEKAIKELDDCREKFNVVSYYGGADTHAVLKERTTKQEVPIKRTGQSALNQVLLLANQQTGIKIEQTDINSDNDKFFINHDESTISSARRAMVDIVAGKQDIHLSFFCAWTLHKEAGYKPTRSFLDWVYANPDVHFALEQKRVSRKFHQEATPTDTES